MSLELVKNSQEVFFWSKSNNELTFFRKYLKIMFFYPKLNIIFMSTIVSSRTDFRKSKLTSNCKNNLFTPFVTW